MKAERGKQTVYLLLSLVVVMAAAIEEAMAVPIPVHRSQANFLDSGGTRVIGCGGEGCASGAFDIGDVSGDTQWAMVTRVFRDAAVPNTSFHYTLFNDTFTENITSFHVENNGLLGAGSAPAGWTFSQDATLWSWSVANGTTGIAITESLGGFDVVMPGSPPVAFNLAGINLADGTVIGLEEWRGPGPGTPGGPGGGIGGALGAPEPASLLLLGSGLAGLRVLRRRTLGAR